MSSSLVSEDAFKTDEIVTVRRAIPPAHSRTFRDMFIPSRFASGRVPAKTSCLLNRGRAGLASRARRPAHKLRSPQNSSCRLKWMFLGLETDPRFHCPKVGLA